MGMTRLESMLYGGSQSGVHAVYQPTMQARRKEGTGLALLGLVVGGVGGLAFTRLLSELLFEVEPTDPLRGD